MVTIAYARGVRGGKERVTSMRFKPLYLFRGRISRSPRRLLGRLTDPLEDKLTLTHERFFKIRATHRS
jgi:hypothetical protein